MKFDWCEKCVAGGACEVPLFCRDFLFNENNKPYPPKIDTLIRSKIHYWGNSDSSALIKQVFNTKSLTTDEFISNICPACKRYYWPRDCRRSRISRCMSMFVRQLTGNHNSKNKDYAYLLSDTSQTHGKKEVEKEKPLRFFSLKK